MNPADLRKRIFNSYSDNLAKVQNAYGIHIGTETENGIERVEQQLYLCPLCVHGFMEIMLDQRKHNPLTLEDLPPKSVGGKAKILTCKKCNNTSGSKLDKLILDSLEAESFLQLKPESSLSTKLKINNKFNLSSRLKITKADRHQFIFNVKQSLYFLTCVDEMKKNWNKTKINVSFSIPSKIRTSVALLRIGYLLSFYHLGHRIIFEENIHKLRKSIIDPENNSLPHCGVFILPDSQSVNEGFHLLISPEEYRTYFMIYKVKIKSYSKIIAVPIPGPGEEGWTNYSKLSQLKKGSQLTFRDFTSKDYIQNPNLVNAYDYIFKNG